MTRNEFEKAAAAADEAVNIYDSLDDDALGFEATGRICEELLALYWGLIDEPAPDLESLKLKAEVVLKMNARMVANRDFWEEISGRDLLPVVQDIVRLAKAEQNRKRGTRRTDLSNVRAIDGHRVAIANRNA